MLERSVKHHLEAGTILQGRELPSVMSAALAQARAEKAVIAVAKIDRLARDAGLVLKLANEAEKNGMGGFVFCDLPDIDATNIKGGFAGGYYSQETIDVLKNEFDFHKATQACIWAVPIVSSGVFSIRKLF